MKIHREGRGIIIWTGVMFVTVGLSINIFCDTRWCIALGWTLCFLLWGLIVCFFRMPNREYPEHTDRCVVAPADGVVVDIAKVKDPEYFDDERIRISVFMSPANVHVNRYPIGGEVVYRKYHPGRYLVAWHPKSSTLNERNTVVLRTASGAEILVRQIAGALARRIVSYAKVGEQVLRGQELGFIKFGSRVDIFLPLTAEIKVEMEEHVRSGISLLAELA
ncbi:MAG: phosphatidylserine decarboxylase family protein [Bacteroidales bacterium]|nr:phosphatidylserine decarboxylase family protein [Bacteroidales bacterium]MDE6440067.1 phosphatidylserine decarboxylase family protein [Bacteroidales bacterium]